MKFNRLTQLFLHSVKDYIKEEIYKYIFDAKKRMETEEKQKKSSRIENNENDNNNNYIIFFFIILIIIIDDKIKFVEKHSSKENTAIFKFLHEKLS